MRTVIVISEVIPGLNGETGLIRENFRKAKVRKLRYQTEIMAQTRNRHASTVNIDWIRYTIKPMDWDNMCASFKHIGDALVNASVLIDDKPTVIINFTPKQIKVAKRNQQRSEVVITDTLDFNPDIEKRKSIDEDEFAWEKQLQKRVDKY